MIFVFFYINIYLNQEGNIYTSMLLQLCYCNYAITIMLLQLCYVDVCVKDWNKAKRYIYFLLFYIFLQMLMK